MGAKEREEIVRVSGMVDEMGQQGKEGRVLVFLTLLVAFPFQFECPLRISDHCLVHS